MFSLKTIILACALISVGISGSSSQKSCKALVEPTLKIAKKISALSDTDYVKLEKLKLEWNKQQIKDHNNGVPQQIEILKKEYAVKGQKDKYKQCLKAEKDERDAASALMKKQDKIYKNWIDSSAMKNEAKWDAEFRNENY